jgi:hypothetical protein
MFSRSVRCALCEHHWLRCASYLHSSEDPSEPGERNLDRHFRKRWNEIRDGHDQLDSSSSGNCGLTVSNSRNGACEWHCELYCDRRERRSKQRGDMGVVGNRLHGRSLRSAL